MSTSQLQTHDQPNPFRAVIFRGEPDDILLVEGHVISELILPDLSDYDGTMST